jgi:hypothetical protein
MLRRHKFWTAGALAALTSLAIGVAFAAWTSSGTGQGSASSTHDQPSQITSSAFAADLYPGATDIITVSVSNPNPYPVIVTSMSPGASPAVNGGACAGGSVFSDALALVPTGLSQTGGTTVVAPHSSGIYALTGHMIGDPSDACKDQTFLLPLTATVQSAA